MSINRKMLAFKVCMYGLVIAQSDNGKARSFMGIKGKTERQQQSGWSSTTRGLFSNFHSDITSDFLKSILMYNIKVYYWCVFRDGKSKHVLYSSRSMGFEMYLKGTYHAKCTLWCLLYIMMCPRCVGELTQRQKIKPSLFSSVPKSFKNRGTTSGYRFAADLTSNRQRTHRKLLSETMPDMFWT